MIRIQKKLSTAIRILGDVGPSSLGRYAFYRGKAFCLKDRWLLGRIVEVSGNTAHVGGCVISLENPFISTRLKSRFLTGLYEAGERYLIKKYLPRDLSVIEFGACIGVVSCLVNRLLEVPDSHLVVEANSHLLPTLQENRAQNSCKFEILNAALAYDVEEVTFYLSDFFVGGSTARETSEAITVPTTTLQQALEHVEGSKVSLICDVEGTEIDLVQREGEVMQKYVAWFFVEMHPSVVGQNKVSSATADLEAMGFRLIEYFGSVQAYRNERFAFV
jgi:FkbM family methyltransferase